MDIYRERNGESEPNRGKLPRRKRERETATRGRKDYLKNIFPQQQDAGSVVEENARQPFEMEAGERVGARVEEYKKGKNNFTKLVKVEKEKKKKNCFPPTRSKIIKRSRNLILLTKNLDYYIITISL